jgi:hypothetical protein
VHSHECIVGLVHVRSGASSCAIDQRCVCDGALGGQGGAKDRSCRCRGVQGGLGGRQRQAPTPSFTRSNGTAPHCHCRVITKPKSISLQLPAPENRSMGYCYTSYGISQLSAPSLRSSFQWLPASRVCVCGSFYLLRPFKSPFAALTPPVLTIRPVDPSGQQPICAQWIRRGSNRYAPSAT